MKTSDNITWRFIIFCIIAFVVTFGMSFLIFQSIPEAEVDFSLTDTSSETLRNREIALIFFGCSTCPAARSERIPSLIEQLSAKVRQEAADKGYAYILIGVSKEYSVKGGMDYLTGIADFDEISLGNGMGNTALQQYVWDTYEHSLSAATPQIILSSRVYDTLSTGGNETDIHPEIISEEILWREVGLSAIERLIINEGFFELF